jgi:hypothetical protein
MVSFVTSSEKLIHTVNQQRPEALNRCFFQWVETLVTRTVGAIIPIDGKIIRGSYDRNQGKSALHVITAWSAEQRRVSSSNLV